MSIKGRIVEHEDGSISLLAPGATRGPLEMTNGRIVDRPKGEGATFSAAVKPKRPTPSGAAQTLCTRVEASKMLGIGVAETAALLDSNEVLRGIGYDRRHVELLADAIKSGKRSGKLDVPLGPMTQLDP